MAAMPSASSFLHQNVVYARLDQGAFMSIIDEKVVAQRAQGIDHGLLRIQLFGSPLKQ